MRTSIATLGAVTAVALAVAGCGSEGAKSRDSGSTTGRAQFPDVPACDEVSSESAGISERAGRLVLQECQKTEIYDSQKHAYTVEFMVTDIVVDPECASSLGQESVKGHLVAIGLETNTISDPGSFEGFSTVLNSPWSAISPDGFVQTNVSSSAATYCVGSQETSDFSQEVGKARFWVVLDLKSDSGTLVFEPEFFGHSSRDGYEWEYSA